MPLNKSGKLQPSRYNTSGDVTIYGKLIVSGSLILSGTTNISGSGSGSVVSLTGSNVFGSLSSDTQVFTGSVYLPFTYASGIIITGSYLTTTYLTGSEVSLGNVIVSGSTELSGNLSVSGSTKFGNNDIVDIDVHQFTGSVRISGSIILTGSSYGFASSTPDPLSVTSLTGSEVRLGHVVITGSLNYTLATSSFATTGRMYIYSNGTSGNDSNTGLTIDSPKKTLSASLNLIPFVCDHSVTVYLSGTYIDYGFTSLNKVANSTILLDGGSQETIVAGEYTSDINSTSTIGLTTAGWTARAYEGYWVKITSGVASGSIRTIHSQSATIIVPTKNFLVDPGASAKFTIVRPTTTLSASSVDSSLVLSNLSNKGGINLQRVYMTGSSGSINIEKSPGLVVLSGIVSDSYKAYPYYSFASNDVRFLGDAIYDPITIVADTNYYTGITSRGGTNTRIIDCISITMSGGSILVLYVANTNDISIINGQAMKYVLFYRVLNGTINSSTGYALTTISNSAASGLYLASSFVTIGNSVKVAANSSHGFYLMENSILRITGTSVVLSGTGNGRGCYLDCGSKLFLTNTAAPTITGSLGECATVAGGLTTWALIDAGTILADLNTMTLAREF